MYGHAMKATFQVNEFLNKCFCIISPIQKISNVRYILHFICMDKSQMDQVTIKAKAYRYQKKTWVDFFYKVEVRTAFRSLLNVLHRIMGKPQKIKLICKTQNELDKFSKFFSVLNLSDFMEVNSTTVILTIQTYKKSEGDL